MKAQPVRTASQDEVQILAAISELMGTSISFEEVITAAMGFVTAMMRADGSSLLLINPKDGTMNFYIALGEKKEQLKNITLAKGEGIAGFVAETGLPLIVSDVTRERRFSKRVDQTTGFKTRAIACVPLRVRGELKGVIEAVSKRVGNFEDKDLDLLTIIAGPLAIMIEHARLLSEMKTLHEQLTQANRIKSEFLATMTHELRTPVNIVISSLDLLLGGYVGDLNDRQKSAITTALRNAQEGLSMITRLLDLSRMEAGQLAVNVEDFRLDDLWNELEPAFQIALSGKEVGLSWTVKAPLPSLKTDKVKVKEIFSNIVFNAIKFTDGGRVQILASPAEKEEAVEIEVKDTGVGIPREFLPVIFEPFRQVETPFTRRHGGVGLGLYIVKKLLNMLRGKIEVESEVGKGSIFRVRIPIRYAP